MCHIFGSVGSLLLILRSAVRLWQGRFKRALPVPDVLTGQRFSRGVRNLPARWLVEAVLMKARSAQHNPQSSDSSRSWVVMP